MDDSVQLKRLQDSICQPDAGLYFAPIRHHSPACAWAIQQLIRDVKPRQILIEAPTDLQHHIKLLVDKGTKPPVAIAVLVDGKSQPRRSAYYPFCAHSPEYVALREGSAFTGADKPTIKFIDLPASDKVMLRTPVAERHLVVDDESYFDSGKFVSAMCRKTGCRNGDELWDHWFESRLGESDWAGFFADVGAYCAALRQSTAEEIIDSNGDQQREQHMAAAIAKALQQQGPVVVITGGFHTPALIEACAKQPEKGAGKSSAKITGKTKQKTTSGSVNSYLIRYGFQALDALNGYTAGLPQPGYYDYLWKRAQKTGGAPAWRVTALDLLSEFAHHLQQDGHSISVPLKVETIRVAESLALMRGREGAGRHDLIDAVRTALVKGEVGAHEVWTERLLAFLQGVDIGDVPVSAGSPPIVEDARARAKSLRLDISDGARRRRRLDIRRKPAHLDASKFLQAMTLLETSFAERQSGPDFIYGGNTGILYEEWSYAWSPSVEGRLVELTAFGDDVVSAAVGVLHNSAVEMRANGKARDIVGISDLFVQGVLAGLAHKLGPFLDALSGDIQAHGEFHAVANTLQRLHHITNTAGPLGIAAELDIACVREAAYRRLVYLCDDLPKTPEAAMASCMEALRLMMEILRSPGAENFDRSIFDEAISRVADMQPPAEILGSVLAMAVLGRLRDSQDICQALSGHFSGSVEEEKDRVGVLRGLLFVSPQIVWRYENVLREIDTLLCGLSEEEFLELLPHIRLAFTALNPRETDRVAESLQQLHGEQGSAFFNTHINATEAELFKGLDLQKALTASLANDGLESWFSSSGDTAPGESVRPVDVDSGS